MEAQDSYRVWGYLVLIPPHSSSYRIRGFMIPIWRNLLEFLGGKSMACLRGFEPPTFGSGVQRSTLLGIWGKPDFQGEMSCFPLRTFSQN